MSFDDRLRDALRRATESQPLDAEHALRDVRSSADEPVVESADDTVVVPLEVVEQPRRRSVRRQRIIGVAAAIALIAGAIALPFALRDDGHDTHDATKRSTTPHPAKKNGKLNPVALQAVASALDATTNTGSFHVVYTLRENASNAPTTTTCQSVPALPLEAPGMGDYPGAALPPTGKTSMVCSGTPNHNVTTTGDATVNVNPFAMKAISNVSNFGPVTVRVDDTSYWESPGSDSVTTPTGRGQLISSFASLVNGTLGPREGAQAMMGLASPTGYLTITKAAITSAAVVGTGTIDGQAVTTYRVSVDPALLADVPGLSPQQAKTIDAAIQQMHEQGFSANTTDISVNTFGVVVHTISTNTYADGGSVVSEDTFSQFGCAGAVDIPGRPMNPVSGDCTSPDEATTTTAPAATVTPTTIPAATSGPATTPNTAGSDATTTTGPPTDTTPTGVTVTTVPAGYTAPTQSP